MDTGQESDDDETDSGDDKRVRMARRQAGLRQRAECSRPMRLADEDEFTTPEKKRTKK